MTRSEALAFLVKVLDDGHAQAGPKHCRLLLVVERVLREDDDLLNEIVAEVNQCN